MTVAIHADDRDLYDAAVAPLAAEQGFERLLLPVTGGATRQDSVRAGLASLEPLAPDAVLIHDAARPFVDGATLERVLAALASLPGPSPPNPWPIR